MNWAPIIAVVAIGMVAFGFWRIFRLSLRFKSHAQNNWKNENFAAREATGSWAEDTQVDGTSTAPIRQGGGNYGTGGLGGGGS